jgi:hypothetical protein
MRIHTTIITLALGAMACHAGKNAQTLGLARSPNGAMATLDLDQGGPITGELLSADDTGLVLLRGKTTLSIPYSRIHRAAFPELDQRYSLDQRGPDAETLRRLRLISHFPQGLSPELRVKIAALYHADTLSR